MKVPGDGSLSRRSVCRVLGQGLAASALGSFAVPSLMWRQQGTGLVIRGGTVANADGTRRADVRIEGERIVQIAASINAPAGVRVIDAPGKLVLPGGIDPHTHLQPAFVDDLTSGSRAALAGGITTLGTFSAPRREETPEAALDRMTGLIQQQAIADFILHTNAGTPRAEFIPALHSWSLEDSRASRCSWWAPISGLRWARSCNCSKRRAMPAS